MDHFLWLGLSVVNGIVEGGMDTGGVDVWEEKRRRLSCVSPSDWIVDEAGGSPRPVGLKEAKHFQLGKLCCGSIQVQALIYS